MKQFSSIWDVFLDLLHHTSTQGNTKGDLILINALFKMQNNDSTLKELCNMLF